MAEFVTLDVRDGIGTIRLSRPPMNALNRQVQGELLAVGQTGEKVVECLVVQALLGPLALSYVAVSL